MKLLSEIGLAFWIMQAGVEDPERWLVSKDDRSPLRCRFECFRSLTVRRQVRSGKEMRITVDI